MTEAELVTVAFQIRDQINFLWNFYVTACAVLIGWIFSEGMSWTKEKYLAVSGLFVVFALINVSAISTEYGLLELALYDLNSQVNSSGQFSAELAESPGLGSFTAVVIHLIVDALLLQLIRYRFNNKKIDTHV